MKQIPFFYYFALVLLLTFGCKPKPLNPSYHCSGNCVLTRISGIAKNMATGEGIPNEKILIYKRDMPNFLFPKEEDMSMAELKTDAKGEFSADLSVDFDGLNTKSYYILVGIDSSVKKNYLFGSYEDYPQKEGYLVHNQGVYSTGSHYLTFDLCPKTTLTLNVKYAHQTDAKESAIYAGFGKKDNGSYIRYAYGFSLLKSKQNKDTTIHFTTGAGEFTYIYKSKKTDFSDEWIEEIDSFKCEKDKNNIYEVKF